MAKTPRGPKKPKEEPKSPDEAAADESKAGLEKQFLPEFTVDDIELKTLSGDVRDVLLTRFHNITVPWHHLNESEQRDVNWSMNECAESLVRKTVSLLTRAKFPTLLVSIGPVKIDKGVEVKLTVTETVDNIVALAQHGKGAAVLVLAEASDISPRADRRRLTKTSPICPSARSLRTDDRPPGHPRA